MKENVKENGASVYGIFADAGSRYSILDVMIKVKNNPGESHFTELAN